VQRGTCFEYRAKAMIIAFALVFVTSGCGGLQQGSGEGETTIETYTSSVSVTGAQRTSPRFAQDQTSPERYEDLEVGESAEFKNGLTVTIEGASIMEAPESLRDRLEANELLIAVRFSVENANPEGQDPRRSFRVSTAQWEALDQNGNPLQTLYPSETSLVAGELPNPSPDYPYTGWQGELQPAQELQGSMLFAASPSTKMRVRFTQPVMSAPLGEWKLGTVSELPQAF
jgi:hypothetical protein